MSDALDAHVDGELAVTTRDVKPAHVLELASDSRCSAYDCEYVALARALGVRLVTADQQILEAFPTIATSLADFTAGK